MRDDTAKKLDTRGFWVAMVQGDLKCEFPEKKLA